MRRRWRLAAGASLAAALACGAAAAAPQAAQSIYRLDSGQVACPRSGPAAVCRAIPYAAPPLGPLRWKPPAPVKHWAGVRAAGPGPGPACLQPILPDGRWNIGGYNGPVSEDCLTLDVTAPAGAVSGALKHGALGHGAAVMVWIPGGGNFAGAANVPSYDAVNFARDGVIVVTMNFRLGPLGFFAHPALTAEAPKSQGLVNYGLMDQIAALKWVKRNIAAFGGDPDNVTIAGESAGGADVLALLATPSARGLFHRALVESGFGWSRPVTLAERERQGAELATRLGLAGDKATAAELRALPAEKLVGSADAGVAVDGRLVTETAVQAFARGDAAPVGLMIGWNSNEASLLGRMDPAAFLAGQAEAVRAAYADQPTDADRMRLIFGDGQVGAPARWFAHKAGEHAPSYLYHFSYVPERERQTRPGTNHASEVPFVFDSLDAVPGRTPKITPSERAAATFTHACVVGFVKTGTPSCPDLAWPAYDPARDKLLEIGLETGVRTNFHKPQLELFEQRQADLLSGR